MNKNKNKNKMNVDAMKRAAKVLMRGGRDLDLVIIDQKCMQEAISKLIPNINNVGSALLKWSYSETNYAFPDVFSAWADLDVGFTHLLQEFLEESSRYRKSFKDIIAEGKKVSDVQKEKEKTASKVASLHAKLDSAKKTAKKNENNDKARQQVSNVESDLFMAKSKDEETEEILRNAIADFEFYKASMLKDSLTIHCQALMSLLQKGTDLCQTKLDIAEAMSTVPAATPDTEAVNSRKVEDIFSKHHLQLPVRDVAVGRTLPMEKFKTLPLPQSHHLSTLPRTANRASDPPSIQNKHLSRPFGGVQVYDPASEDDSDDGDDDDDYMMPNEDIIAKATEKSIPPELPPRNVVEEEEEYVVPTLSTNPQGAIQFSPTRDKQTDYFEVVSEDHNESPVKPSNGHNPPRTLPLQLEREREPPAPIDEPLYTAPTDNDESDDHNQLYGNMSNEELVDHQRTLVTIPARPQGKPRKPAVYPKPQLRQSVAMPSLSPQEASCPISEAAGEDDDIYSLVYDDTPTSGETGVSPSAPPVAPRYLESEQADHHGNHSFSDSPDRQIEHTYLVQCHQSQESLELATDISDDDVQQTYYLYMHEGEKQNCETEQMYGNVPGAYSPETEKEPSPPVTRKPQIMARKPAVPARGGIK